MDQDPLQALQEDNDMDYDGNQGDTPDDHDFYAPDDNRDEDAADSDFPEESQHPPSLFLRPDG